MTRPTSTFLVSYKNYKVNIRYLVFFMKYIIQFEVNKISYMGVFQ